nr:UDP-N-acetylglucosamine 2-epimerase (non-hydrolyzing) [uncultured Acetatifactor sp.]
MKKRVLLVFGTRPEAIKMCPIVKELKKRNGLDIKLCATGQHKEMLMQVLDVFGEEPDYNLKVMRKVQNLSDTTTLLLGKMSKLLQEIKPDIVLVHGDTLSAFVTALACYYARIPVAHVEAGLRTYDIMSPYPEEFNRQAVDAISWLMFAPTGLAAENLKREGRKAENIFVTGNTVIDALSTTISNQYKSELLDWAGDDRLILLTAHRRENIGSAMENIFRAVKTIVNEIMGIKVVYPVHLNPEVKSIADSILKEDERIRLIEPLDVVDFHNLMNRAYVIVTDSGGIQEEAPALGKPVLVVRDTTERPEGVEAGTLKLVGTERQNIERELRKILEDEQEYLKMAKAVNPYGDGHASEKIADVLERRLGVGNAG